MVMMYVDHRDAHSMLICSCTNIFDSLRWPDDDPTDGLKHVGKR
jgi:hypothetical protein